MVCWLLLAYCRRSVQRMCLAKALMHAAAVEESIERGSHGFARIASLLSDGPLRVVGNAQSHLPWLWSLMITCLLLPSARHFHAPARS